MILKIFFAWSELNKALFHTKPQHCWEKKIQEGKWWDEKWEETLYGLIKKNHWVQIYILQEENKRDGMGRDSVRQDETLCCLMKKNCCEKILCLTFCKKRHKKEWDETKIEKKRHFMSDEAEKRWKGWTRKEKMRWAEVVRQEEMGWEKKRDEKNLWSP